MSRNRFRMRNGTRVALALAASSLATLSCSVIVNDTNTKQCSVDTDCANLGAEFAGSVCQHDVCVAPGSVSCSSDSDCTVHGSAFPNTVCQKNLCVAPDPLMCRTVAQTNPTVKLTFTIGFAAKPTGDQGTFTVLACDRLDVDCTSPVAGPVTEDPTTPNSGVELDLPYNFLGYLQIQNPVTVPAMEFLARPLQRDTAGWNLTLATPNTVNLLGAATGTTIKQDLGLFIMVARDCNRAPIAGVQASLNVSTGDTQDAGPDTTVPFYIANMFPNKSLTATTNEGAAGFANVPIGSAALSGVIQASNFQLPPTTAISRAGWISYVEVQP